MSTAPVEPTGTTREVNAAPETARGVVGGTRAFLRLVLIEHSVFALPFAYISALWAMFETSGHVNWVQAAADHRGHGRRPHLRDGDEPHHRPRDRRPEPAHRRCASWSPARCR